MYYPYAFEFAVKAGLMKDGKLAEPLIEPKVTELIAAFSRVAILQLTTGMGCHRGCIVPFAQAIVRGSLKSNL